VQSCLWRAKWRSNSILAVTKGQVPLLKAASNANPAVLFFFKDHFLFSFQGKTLKRAWTFIPPHALLFSSLPLFLVFFLKILLDSSIRDFFPPALDAGFCAELTVSECTVNMYPTDGAWLCCFYLILFCFFCFFFVFFPFTSTSQ